MTRKHVSLVASSVLLVLLLGSQSNADLILTKFGSGTPTDSWTYLKAEGVGHGNSTTYMPVIADWASAAFQGYVFQSPTEAWNTVGSGIHDEDTIYVFRTYALASSDVTIPLRLGGDDGHSIYVDDVFVGGGGFAVNVDFDLILKAGLQTKIELGVYNGPGAMIAELYRRDNNLRIQDAPGVTINANAVPEPSSLVLAIVGGGFLLGTVRFRTRHSRAGGAH